MAAAAEAAEEVGAVAEEVGVAAEAEEASILIPSDLSDSPQDHRLSLFVYPLQARRSSTTPSTGQVRHIDA